MDRVIRQFIRFTVKRSGTIIAQLKIRFETFEAAKKR